MRYPLLLLILFCLTGCSWTAYTNKELKTDQPEQPNPRATFNIEVDRGDDDVLLILALSGGGSRAAYFSSQIMLRLQEVFPNLDILQKVDAISSVSGGSLAAAYYCFSMDPDGSKAKSGRTWDRDTVTDVMSSNYLGKWIGNWFWPQNIALYWTTPYDRSDMMAQTFADNLFDVQFSWENILKPWKWGQDLRIRDINLERPYLILNATSGTEQFDKQGDFPFGHIFTFTREDFYKYLRSDIERYPIANAVVASAAFPAVFNYVTLKDFHPPENNDRDHYLHVFDGGNADNLGLNSTRRLIKENAPKFERIVVIAVDSFTRPKGVDRDDWDTRKYYLTERFIDLNFMDTIDSLMSANRDGKLAGLRDYLQENYPSNSLFVHIAFEGLEKLCSDDPVMAQVQGHDECRQGEEFNTKLKNLKRDLDDIPTSWRISTEQMASIDHAVQLLINPDNQALVQVREMLERGGP